MKMVAKLDRQMGQFCRILFNYGEPKEAQNRGRADHRQGHTARIGEVYASGNLFTEANKRPLGSCGDVRLAFDRNDPHLV